MKKFIKEVISINKSYFIGCFAALFLSFFPILFGGKHFSSFEFYELAALFSIYYELKEQKNKS